jgi:hypothetical protein
MVNSSNSRAYRKPYTNRAYATRAYESNGHKDSSNISSKGARHRWFWIYGYIRGREEVLGKFATRAKADLEGIQANFDAPYEVYNLPTETKEETLKMIHRLGTMPESNRYTRYQGRTL